MIDWIFKFKEKKNRTMARYMDGFDQLPSRGKRVTDLVSIATSARAGIYETSYMNMIDTDDIYRSEEVWFTEGSRYDLPLQKKIYEFRKCVDVKLFETYVIISGDNHVIKVDRQSNSVCGDLNIAGAGKMCKIRGSRKIAVIQRKTPNIVVISTHGKMRILYKISTTELQYVDQYRLPAYNNICFLGYLKHENFCVAYTGTDGQGRSTEVVDSVTRGIHHRKTRSTWRTFETKKTSFPANILVGMTCMDAFSDDEFIIGYHDEIASFECFKMSARKTELFENWSKPMRYGITSICCHRDRIYAGIARERRVIVLDRNGVTLIQNLIPNEYIIRPRSVSVYENTIAVSEYDPTIRLSKVYILELRDEGMQVYG